LRDLAPELNEHDGVKNEIQELSGENPEIMSPKTEYRVLCGHPTLRAKKYQ
jgi:hypothetical protein